MKGADDANFGLTVFRDTVVMLAKFGEIPSSRFREKLFSVKKSRLVV